jgi:NifU-like protein involved in Fe-S cluster formation
MTEEKNVSPALEEFNQLLREEMQKAYSEKAIEYFTNPQNLGPLDDASGYATVTDSHGDQLHLWLIIEDNRITGASYFTRGCISIKIAGGALTELVKGKTLEEAMEISPSILRHFIGRMPRQTWHCTNLAVAVLRDAIRNHVVLRVFINPENQIVQIDL